jgi:cyanophycinase
MGKQYKGQLIIIGGHEDQSGNKNILQVVADAAKKGSGPLVIVTVASEEPDAMIEKYRTSFGELGVSKIEMLDIRDREEALSEERVKLISEASAVFFTGGDQLRITSQFGGSPVCQAMREMVLSRNGTVAGTSAGAAVMPETMLVSGPSDSSFRVDQLELAPGLGLISEVIIDSHFSERGRIGRLLGAVAFNPANIGLGLDEDTAIVVRRQHFEVVGSGAVYIVDGSKLSYSSLGKENTEGVASLGNMCMHILAVGDKYDLTTRQPQFAGQ